MEKNEFPWVFTSLYQVTLWLFGTIVSTVEWRFHFKTKPAQDHVIQMGSSAALHPPFLQHLFDWAVISSENQAGNPQKMNNFLLIMFPKPARCGVRQALEPAQRTRWDHVCEKSRRRHPFGPSFSLVWLTSWRHTQKACFFSQMFLCETHNDLEVCPLTVFAEDVNAFSKTPW